MIYYDGKIFADTGGLGQRLAPGKVSGRGVFETMRSVENKILQLDQHLARLRRGLRILNIPPPCSQTGYQRVLKQLLSGAGAKDSRIRLMVWRHGRKTHMCIVVVPYKPFPPQSYQKGMRAAIASRHLGTGDLLFEIKSVRYQKFLEAYDQARQKGFDEAVLVHKKGYVIEASRANIFFVKQGVLVTPALTCGCLNGITRRRVLTIAGQKGILCKETRVFPQDLCAADEVFFTNSLIGIMPLTYIDNIKIGRGASGPVTKKLIRAYKSACCA